LNTLRKPPGGGVKSEAFARLLAVSRRLHFEPHDIARQLDERGRYEVELDREFPFLIKLFHYTSRRHTRGATWHERVELFMPLDGLTRFRLGEQEVELRSGDLLVVDSFKLHHVVDFPGFDTRVVVVSFLPDFVYSLGSPSHDYAFLLPFYSRSDQQPQVLRASESAASQVFASLAHLLERYFAATDRRLYQAGCKAGLLELLYHLARRFCSSEFLKWEFVREQQRSLRLKPLFEHIRHHSAEKLTVAQAAGLTHMSQPQLMKMFKKVAGMTLIAYLNHVRLSNATRLLKETALSIAEVASEVGFADQSYFDKQFKRAFGCPPKQFRQEPERGRPPKARRSEVVSPSVDRSISGRE
jgi:AraC family transcriptional regulator, transcriptional activator of pobA